jgi:ankyrin repeat protein
MRLGMKAYALYSSQILVGALLIGSGTWVQACGKASHELRGEDPGITLKKITSEQGSPSVSELSKKLLELVVQISGTEKRKFNSLELRELSELFSQGARAEERSLVFQEFTPIFFAAELGDQKLADLLISNGAELNKQTSVGYTPLIYAAYNGHSQVVESLLKGGARIDIRGKDGDTALHLAAWNGQTDSIRLLLEGGAEIDVHSNEADTPLHLAIFRGYPQSAQLLIENGANIEERTAAGFTALTLAAYHGNFQNVEFLAKSRARIHEKTNSGSTGPMLAAGKGHDEILGFLLTYAQKNGPADFDYWGHCNNEGKSAVHYAIESDRLGSIIVLFDHLAQYPGERLFSVEVNQAIGVAFKLNKKEIIHYLHDRLDRKKHRAIRDAVKPSDPHSVMEESIIDWVHDYSR